MGFIQPLRYLGFRGDPKCTHTRHQPVNPADIRYRNCVPSFLR
jgi:hypothetical protein